MTDYTCKWTKIRGNDELIKAPLWKRGGYIGFGLSVIPSVRSFVRHNFFVPAQYLQNSFIEFIQILYVHWYWHALAWDCYTSFSPNFTRVMALYLRRNFVSAWELLDIFSPNFIYTLMLTRSSLHIIFQTYVLELWPLIYAEILFLLNILRTTRHIFTKFYIYIDIDKI